MPSTNRQWECDGEMRNAHDAKQMVSRTRSAFTRRRARWIIEAAIRHGHPAECNDVFRDALDNLEW